MARLLKDEHPAFLASYDMPPSIGIRVNTLKIVPDVFRQMIPFELAPVLWCSPGSTILVRDNVVPGKHPFHAAGLDHLQDPSAMAVIELLIRSLASVCSTSHPRPVARRRTSPRRCRARIARRQ